MKIGKQNFPNLNIFGGEIVAKLLMQLSYVNKLNKIYSRNLDKNGIEFIDSVINKLELKFEVREEELQRIPKSGAFITVSNHPFAGIDGLLLAKVLHDIRPDYKVLVSSLLNQIEPIRDFVFPDNPFDAKKVVRPLYQDMKPVFNYLKQGGCLGFFPAGEVSSYPSDSKNSMDIEWKYATVRFIKRAGVPVIPIYFHGANTRILQLLGRINPLIRKTRLPSENIPKKNRVIRIKIGNPISVKEQLDFNDISQFGRFLRAKTYSLASVIEVKRFFKPRIIKREKKPEDIIAPVAKELLAKEIEGLVEEYQLFSNNNYSVICAPSIEIPNLLTEIGRLREITFRAVGEGTNRSIDLDEFDLYYNQLIIWDNDEQAIVGAYRVGKGDEIIAQYGIKGFYIQTLFKISNEFIPILEESIELGRSFIVEKYQRKPLSLFLLWKGILYFLLKHSEYRYMIGPVSISNQFTKFSKSLIVDFIKTGYFDYELAKYITPRKQFKISRKYNINKEILIKNTKNDFKKLDKFIRDIEPYLATPVLIKKYIQLNAKMIGFNIDPDFNDCLDGLVLLDIFDIPPQTIEALSKEINDNTILERFNVKEI